MNQFCSLSCKPSHHTLRMGGRGVGNPKYTLTPAGEHVDETTILFSSTSPIFDSGSVRREWEYVCVCVWGGGEWREGIGGTWGNGKQGGGREGEKQGGKDREKKGRK